MGNNMSRSVMTAVAVSLTLAGCVATDPFLTKETRLANGKEYRLKVGGEFKKPEGKGPFPAVIILQSCGGSSPSLYDWADKMNGWGYATFLVKSLEARGMQTCQQPFSRVMMYMDVASDAIGALEHLAKKPDVDPKRIAVIGFSLGAGAINSEILPNYRNHEFSNLDFAGAISFYQRCDRPMKALERFPVLQITASLDHAHHTTCANYKTNWGHNDIAKHFDRLSVVSYEGVHHAFDDTKMYSMKSDIGGNTMLYNQKAHQDSVVRVRDFLSKTIGGR
jgi:dienelactone hydrolase